MEKYKMKSGIVTTVLFLLNILISGCDSLLEKNPLDSLSTSTFWQTETDAMLALTGVYQLNEMTGSGQKLTHNIWNQDAHLRLFEATTDNGFEKDNNVTDINNGDLASSYGPVKNLWTTSYRSVIKCNNFLDNIGSVNMEASRMEEMKAEVKTIRAYAYFYLSFLWGDVPLVTKVLSVSEANSVSRDSKAEVVDFVISELQSAIQYLPNTRPDDEYGRITKGGALAILGRVLLAEKRWDEAKSAYRQIMDLGIYDIDPRFSDLFIEAGEGSKEFLLVSVRMPEIYGTSIQLSCVGFTWGGYHHYSPFNELVEDFECIDGKPITESPLFNPEKPYENRDPRLLKTIMVDNISVYKGTLYVAHPDSSPTIYQDQVTRRPWSGYILRKFCDESYSGNFNTYGGDFTIIRYAEVLLSYLEACIESGTAITQPLLDETINKVRGRAEIQMPEVTETDPAKLTTILRRERRVELAWEGLRLYDLFRWRTAHTRIKGRFHGMKICSAAEAPSYTKVQVNENGYYYCEESNFRESVDYLWPIPQSEKDVNGNLTQNPGY
ncbi:MAG: RagB/SusD family nutrient uptake outer membrane protein [Tannerellaceae bacterium]|jgi:hypothetical protein|nr:RagB/SusD family nutrient uptake outer membrane protein [Tannerellaceae bacterium]